MENVKVNRDQLRQIEEKYKNKYISDDKLWKCNFSKYGKSILNDVTTLDMIDKYNELCDKFDDMIRKEKPLGKSEDGSRIPLYSLGNGSKSKKWIVLVAGVHGNEKSSVMGLYLTIKDILNNLSNRVVEFILDNFEIKIIPFVNSYGFNHNVRNNSNDKDLNRDFKKMTQSEVKSVCNYIKKNKNKVVMVLDSHNAYNETFISCKKRMPHFKKYSDVCFRLRVGMGDLTKMKFSEMPFLFVSESSNNGTFSDFINENGFYGHTVEAPRSVFKYVPFEDNVKNYYDGCSITVYLLINLMYIYGKMYLIDRYKE